jgi:hypothetical protein
MNRQLQRLWGVVACLCLPFTVEAQTNVIALQDSTSITVQTPSVYEVHYHKSVKILNEKGSSAAVFVTQCSKDDKITAFSGMVTDEDGQVIRKIKKSELQSTAYSKEMATDVITIYLDYTPPTYPIIITYDWCKKVTEGAIEYPSFSPQSTYNLEVKKASYRLSVPQNMICRYTMRNTAATVRCTSDKDNTIYELSMSDIPAVIKEPYSLPLSERAPEVLFAPVNFEYKGTRGSLSSWNDFGKWHDDLLIGRDLASGKMCMEVHQLTDSCTTVMSKIAALYRYLEGHTRYVSIQLGIGGCQPAPASEVYNEGFGDCKGLTNFMRTMLKEAGVKSYYTIIGTDEKQLLRDFPNEIQFNHAILQVPLPHDTLWIECTDPTLPLGYVHSDIAGHDALVITDTGGKIFHLPDYADTCNLQRSDVHIELQTDGTAKIRVQQISALRQYEDKRALLFIDENKRKEYIQNMTGLSGSPIENVYLKENHDGHFIPSLQLEFSTDNPGYAGKSGDRMFVSFMPLRKSFNEHLLDNRSATPIRFSYGYRDEDHVYIQLPEGYTAESLPTAYRFLNTSFGTFVSSVKSDGRRLEITSAITMHKGIYPSEESKQIKAFFKSISDFYNQNIILKRLP